ncbi:MAG: dTDP-4-dehydrorhamnose 3,5-epimerase [Terrimicrobiaceae bacterium]
MNFIEAPLSGAYIIEMESSSDERGSFGRAFSAREFCERGLEGGLTEISISRNLHAGTLRGMHFQKEPHSETKLVRVIKGAAFDVIVDIRKDSPTWGKWFGLELSAENCRSLYIPRGFAHGFLTLKDNTDMLYQISDTFHADAATGFTWNDPKINIVWPGQPVLVSEKDQNWLPLQ